MPPFPLVVTSLLGVGGGKVSSTPLGGCIHQEKEEIFHSSYGLSKGAGPAPAPQALERRWYKGLSSATDVADPLLAEGFLQGKFCLELSSDPQPSPALLPHDPVTSWSGDLPHAPGDP